METIKFSDIKPIGNFDTILVKLRDKTDQCISKCKEENQYNSSLAKLAKFTVDIISVLEEGFEKGEPSWNDEEAMKCLLYSHLIIIDLNQTAHTYLNPSIIFPSREEQLKDYIRSKPKVFKNLKISL